MLELYQNLSIKFPDYHFGYTDHNTNMFYDLSVAPKTFGRSAHRKMIEIGLPLQQYADLFIEMLKELRNDKASEGDEGQV